MDVLNEQVIDIALNVIGYSSALGLGVLLHALIAGRRTAPKPRPEVAVAAPAREPDLAGRMQFVDFRAEQNVPATKQTPRANTKTTGGFDVRRDRPEMIRMARQMLKAGTPAETVRRTLPISDAELALLQSAIAR